MKVFTPSANPQPLDEYIYANPRDLTCVVSIHRNTGGSGSIYRMAEYLQRILQLIL